MDEFDSADPDLERRLIGFFCGGESLLRPRLLLLLLLLLGLLLGLTLGV